METYSLDPYEQQLLSVFNSYDQEHVGTLDESGLSQLCQTLQLEEHSNDLICGILGDKNRATFVEFKDALLALLGKLQGNGKESPVKKCDKGSPEREVSPKFIYGSKKYGRRSRPKAEDNIINTKNDDEKSPVQRSTSHTEVTSKKRKTSLKLKRCASVPDHDDPQFLNSSIHNLENSEFTEEMLREAWKNLGVGEDGYLNQSEIILVCNAIGLHKLANGVIRQLSDKLTMDFDHRISFQELLEALKEDETWRDVLNSTPTSNLVNSSVNTSMEALFPDSSTFQYVTLGPDGNGLINTNSLIEMWENIGIIGPKELLVELGFNAYQISIVDLANILEKELKGLNEANEKPYDPHTTLLKANLTLYQSEIKTLRTVLEQLNAERDKLKYDICEANNRATLLAQEVDDNHLKMEQNTLNQVKLLEQRHAEILKQVTLQLSEEKEDITSINSNLESKINCLEQEITKLKNDLQVAQNYSSNLEKENSLLNNRISELQQVKTYLTDQVLTLENECQKYSELEHDKIKPLLSKLTNLESENSTLKDVNDEMVSQIDLLSNQMSALKCKVSNSVSINTLDISMDDSPNLFTDGSGQGAKRRSDFSPTKENMFFTVDGASPRLGKMRKIPKNPDERLTSSESGFDTEIENFDSFSQLKNENKEITRLQAKIAFLEQVLAQHDIPVPNCDSLVCNENAQECEQNIPSLNKRVKDLEIIFTNVRNELKNAKNCDSLTLLGEKLEKMLINPSFCDPILKTQNKEISTMTDCDTTLNIDDIKKQNTELSEKCIDLETCIDLLKKEFENCEDYWSNKLEEERQIFEKEQEQNSEKLTDLIQKMHEYEEQFAINPDDGRLPTINETFNLEKQFTDLEEEYESYKNETQKILSSKDAEITLLKEKLTQLAIERQNNSEKTKSIGTQVDSLSEYNIISDKMQQLTGQLVECTDLYPSEATPNWSISSDLASSSIPEEVNFTPKQAFSGAQNETQTGRADWILSSGAGSQEKLTTPCRPKRTRKHDKNILMYKKNNVQSQNSQTQEKVPLSQEKDFKNDQNVVLPVGYVRNLNARCHHLEQRCRHLQTVVKQQHYFTEQSLQQCWQRQQAEKSELQYLQRHTQDQLEHQLRVNRELMERLARADLLVKELYVENSYQIAKVQRMEQKCHYLAQSSNSM